MPIPERLNSFRRKALTRHQQAQLQALASHVGLGEGKELPGLRKPPSYEEWRTRNNAERQGQANYDAALSQLGGLNANI